MPLYRVPGARRHVGLAAVVCLAIGLAFVPAGAAQDDLRLEVARQWAEKGEYEKAVQELRLFLNEHPEAAEVYARIGSLRLRQGKHKQAAENFRLALQKDPGLAEAKEGMARIRQAESRPMPAADAGPAAAPVPEAAPAAKAAPPADAPPAPGTDAATAGDREVAEAGPSSAPSGIYALEPFQRALRQYREKQPDASLASLKQVLAQSPGHPGAYYLGGVIRYERGELDKAVYNFKRSFDYPERGFNAHFYLGRIRQRQGRIPEAVDHFEKYLAATRNEAGRKQVERILAQLKAQPNPATPPGDAKVAKPAKDDKKAKPPSVAEAKPHSEPAHTEKPHGQMPHGEMPHGGKARGAVPPGDTARAAGTPGPRPPAERSPSPLVLVGEGRPPFVVADSAGASGRSLLRAYDAYRKEKFEQAADLLKETIREYGGSPNAEAADLDLAAVYIRLGLWDNARDRILSYLTAARQPQRFRDLAFYLEGLMHLGRGDGEKAERALLKVGRAAGPDAGAEARAGGFGVPARDEVDWRLAQAGELMKDKKKWAAYLEKARASARTALRKAELSQRLGQLHGRHGRPERALEHYRQSLEPCGKAAGTEDGAGALDSLCRESRLRIADLEFRRKDWKAALEGYRSFAADFPSHKEAAWAHYQIGNVYQATRNLESALNQYKKVIDNYPDSYWASQAQWKREDAIWRKEYEEVLD